MLDILMLYEHKNRELESLILLKIEMENRGYSVEIQPVWDFLKLRYLIFKKPRILVVPWLYGDFHVDWYSNWLGQIRALVNLRWEQVPTPKGINHGYGFPKGMALKAYHICWGDIPRYDIVSRGVPETHAILTGALHIDLLRPEFKAYYTERNELARQYGIDPSKKWILYISSFTIAEAENSKLDAIEADFGMSLRDIQNIMQVSKHHTLEWVRRLLNEEKDIVFIYRPHPFEMQHGHGLKEIEERYVSFKVIPDMSVRHWIFACDTVFTWFSTSITEAFFAGRHCGIVRPCPIPEEFDPVIFKDASIIDNFNDFKKSAISYSKFNFLAFPIKEENIKQYYSNDVSLKPAYLSTCDLLEDVYWNASDKVFLNRHIYIKIKYLMMKAIRLVYTRTGFRLSWLSPVKRTTLRNIENYRQPNAEYISKQELDRQEEALRRLIVKPVNGGNYEN